MERQIDVLALGRGETAAERVISVISESKAKKVLTERHLRALEQVRAALGANAAHARCFSSGSAHTRSCSRLPRAP